MASDALRTSLFREVAGNASLFLYPYFAVLSWLSPGISPETTEISVRTAMAANFKLAECFTSARRFLEDRHLPADLVALPESFQPGRENGQVFLQIIEEAQSRSEATAIKFYLVIGNILPLFVLFQALYRSIISWGSSMWLPGDFFVHALFLIVVSTLPGYLLVSKAINRISAGFSLQSSNKTPELPAFDHNISEIERILQEASELSNLAEAQLTDLRSQLPQETFGISTRN
jgi:hypothetical protein